MKKNKNAFIAIIARNTQYGTDIPVKIARLMPTIPTVSKAVLVLCFVSTSPHL